MRVFIAPGCRLDDPDNVEWVDITSFVRIDQQPIMIRAGRDNDAAQIQPLSCHLAVDNSNGEFSYLNPHGPWYGDLDIGTPLRVLPMDMAVVDASTADSDHLGIITEFVAPSVHTPAAGMLLCCWATTAVSSSGTMSVPSSMTVGPAIGGNSPVRIAWEHITHGDTGTRTATFSGDSWNYSAASIALPGATTAVEILSGTVASGSPLTLTTSPATETGQWIIAINRSNYRTTMDDQPGGTPAAWAVLADGEVSSDLVGGGQWNPWIKVWARPVTAPGAQTVTFGPKDFGDTNHGFIFVVDHLDFESMPWMGVTERFLGEITELPTDWEIPTRRSFARIEAAGPFQRLQQNDEPLESTLRRQVSSERFADTVKAYWPMEDQPGANSFASPTPRTRPIVFGGDIDLASVDGPGGSDRLPMHRHKSTFFGTVPGPPLLSEIGTWRVDWLWRMPEEPPADRTALTVFTTSSTAHRWRVRVGSTVRVEVVDEDGAVLHNGSVAIDPDLLYGDWVRFMLRARSTGGLNTEYALQAFRPDGENPILLASFGTTFSPAWPGTVHQVGVSNLAPQERSWGHIVVSAAWSNDHDPFAGNADDGHAGERAGRRIIRLCDEEDVPVEILGDPDATPKMGPQRPGSFPGLLRECEEADGGTLVERGIGFVYRTRSDRYNQPVRLELSPEPDLPIPPEAKRDAQRFRNKWTITRVNGSSAAVADPEHRRRYGHYDGQASLNLRRDRDLEPIAWWKLHLGTVDEYHWPRVTVRLSPQGAGRQPAWAATQLGDLMRLDHEWTQILGVRVEQLIEGWTETISTDVWEVDLNCSPASPWRVLQFDSDEFGRLDTDGSVLAAAFTSGVDTSMMVEITDGPLWTTDSADLPLHVWVGGVELRVTDVAGTASPQTFTVDADPVNGVEKALAVGEPVRLARPSVWAL